MRASGNQFIPYYDFYIIRYETTFYLKETTHTTRRFSCHSVWVWLERTHTKEILLSLQVWVWSMVAKHNSYYEDKYYSGGMRLMISNSYYKALLGGFGMSLILLTQKQLIPEHWNQELLYEFLIFSLPTFLPQNMFNLIAPKFWDIFATLYRFCYAVPIYPIPEKATPSLHYGCDKFNTFVKGAFYENL